MNDLLAAFVEYRKRVSIERIRPNQVPADLRPLYNCYMTALVSQLDEPENQSTDSLGPDQRANAMQAVALKFGVDHCVKERGNCPRCGGTGMVMAYRHIKGGECLKCGGSGWIKC